MEDEITVELQILLAQITKLSGWQVNNQHCFTNNWRCRQVLVGLDIYYTVSSSFQNFRQLDGLGDWRCIECSIIFHFSQWFQGSKVIGLEIIYTQLG